jgi:hypothetical protein
MGQHVPEWLVDIQRMKAADQIHDLEMRNSQDSETHLDQRRQPAKKGQRVLKPLGNGAKEQLPQLKVRRLNVYADSSLDFPDGAESRHAHANSKSGRAAPRPYFTRWLYKLIIRSNCTNLPKQLQCLSCLSFPLEN